jgi:hypothetical protein
MKRSYEKLLKQAQRSMKLNKDAVIKIWNHSSPHFNGDAPHRYDGCDLECSYCLRPKNWKVSAKKFEF